MEPLTVGLVDVLSAAAARLRASLRCVDDLVGGVSAAADDLDGVLVTAAAAADDLDDVLVAAAAAADDLDDVLVLSCCGFLMSFSAGVLFSGSVRMLVYSSAFMRSETLRSMCLA